MTNLVLYRTVNKKGFHYLLKKNNLPLILFMFSLPAPKIPNAVAKHHSFSAVTTVECTSSMVKQLFVIQLCCDNTVAKLTKRCHRGSWSAYGCTLLVGFN